MAQLSAKEAADHTGMTKAGIIKAIKTGKLSAAKNDNGEWQIDPSELFRAYPPRNTGSTVDVTPQVDAGTPHQVNGLQAEIEKLRELLEAEKRLTASEAARADDLARRLDQEGQERRQLLAMLTDARVQDARRSIWSKLLGR